MIKKFWAKTNPIQTIQEHTDKLLKNLDILTNIYPKIQVNLELLRYACIYHDFGKMNTKFQSKMQTIIDGKKKHYSNNQELPHGILSLPFINFDYLFKKGFKVEDIIILFHSIAYHHDRYLDYDDEDLEREIKELKKEIDDFRYEIVDDFLILNNEIDKYFYSKNARIYEQDNNFYNYVMLKGLLNRLDYAASANINVEVKNDFLLEGLENLRKKEHWEKWNNLQEFMIKNTNRNVVVVAQTGMGKTEAGLLWIGNNKGFFTLPLKTAINEIYKRIITKIVEDREKTGLLHSDTLSLYLEYDKQHNYDEIDTEMYFNKTKQLSLPITICTLDQLFDIVFKYRGFESKLATLSYSKIVIDEVQMYSADLLAYLIVGLYYITKVGGKFAILTATLPGIVKDLLRSEGIKFEEPNKPFIDNQLIRHSIKIENSNINAKYIIEKFNNNKVLVICNTVKRAREIYQELILNNKVNDEIIDINLLHSRFIRKDRKEKEELIVNFGDRNYIGNGIWIATQVVEASLDIDFDILITELSDINGLLQRMGRCYRKRSFNEVGYNCFVFNGGEKLCSGVGNVIDKDIFKFSKQSLGNIDGLIKESDKLKLVEEVYSTKRLKNTKYYNDVIKNINYIKSITAFEKGKKEVDFRNIESITILPKCVYLNNKSKIDLLIELYMNKSANYLQRQKCFNDLQDYFVNVPCYELEKIRPEIIDLSQYRKILIYDGFDYNNSLGLVKKSISKTNVYDNMI